MNLNILSKFDLRQKIAVSIFVFLIFIGIVIYFTIIPSVRDIIIIKNDIYAQKVDLEMKYLKGQNLRNLTEKLIAAEERMQDIDQAFVDGSDDLKFIVTLEEIAEKNNVTQKINILKPENSGAIFSKVPIQIFSQGSVADQLNYLTDLERLNFYININSLEITSTARRNENQAASNVSLFISADSYWTN